MTDSSDPDSQTQRPQSRPSGSGKKALGKGLGALIGESRAALGRSGAGAAPGEGRLRELPLADISVNRRQPRRTFADDDFDGERAFEPSHAFVDKVDVQDIVACSRRRLYLDGDDFARVRREDRG